MIYIKNNLINYTHYTHTIIVLYFGIKTFFNNTNPGSMDLILCGFR